MLSLGPIAGQSCQSANFIRQHLELEDPILINGMRPARDEGFLCAGTPYIYCGGLSQWSLQDKGYILDIVKGIDAAGILGAT